ncbi:MAG: TIGR04282 family arsenosugar biosynthesis glycosyltransferase [Phycicoccus sp.]
MSSLLVMAKAPVPGQAKTRLAVAVGRHGAADLAAAALLDTLDAGALAFPGGRRVLALAGELDGACREPELRAALGGWLVIRQRGASFADRIADGHRRAHALARGPVTQIGMDTPHVDPALLAALPRLARRTGRPVLGPAEDGGWWVLVSHEAHDAGVLAGVPMSRPDTGRLTAAALAAAGTPPEPTVTLRDVDRPDDAAAVAALAPQTRFARTWRALRDEPRVPRSAWADARHLAADDAP